MRRLDEFVDALNDPIYEMIAWSSHSWLARMRGTSTSGSGMLLEDPPGEKMVWWLEIPAVARRRRLLADGSAPSFEKAESEHLNASD